VDLPTPTAHSTYKKFAAQKEKVSQAAIENPKGIGSECNIAGMKATTFEGV
jgi:hypothetical protein